MCPLQRPKKRFTPVNNLADRHLAPNCDPFLIFSAVADLKIFNF